MHPDVHHALPPGDSLQHCHRRRHIAAPQMPVHRPQEPLFGRLPATDHVCQFTTPLAQVLPIPQQLTGGERLRHGGIPGPYPACPVRNQQHRGPVPDADQEQHHQLVLPDSPRATERASPAG